MWTAKEEWWRVGGGRLRYEGGAWRGVPIWRVVGCTTLGRPGTERGAGTNAATAAPVLPQDRTALHTAYCILHCCHPPAAVLFLPGL